MRLNRFLALSGISSRRGAEEYIREGRVTVNGELITSLATQVVFADTVKVDGRIVTTQEFVYLLLNKPEGFLTTVSDERSRKTIYDLLPADLPSLAHVGRLDKESEGLLLLTNDGDLAFRITHPKFKLEKEYLVTLDREFDVEDLPKTKKGVYLAEGRARFDLIAKINARQVRVVLTQGLKRQVRRVFAALGYKVKRLQRVRIGPITDRGLRSGGVRSLSQAEVNLLKNLRSRKVRCGGRV
ncbi:MAG: rRNA pseudouridine synthase [Verrucomicrobia bacterium]|nr:rRNA pseudouridine synthase [Verrucomicrobiota bacterium]